MNNEEYALTQHKFDADVSQDAVAHDLKKEFELLYYAHVIKKAFDEEATVRNVNLPRKPTSCLLVNS